MNSKTEKTLNEIDSDSLKKLIYFLESFGKPYFIHAGFALYLRGFSSEIDDIDVKIFHDDFKDIYISAEKLFGRKVKMKKQKNGNFGSYLFPDSIRIELKTPVDICTHTGAINDLGEIEFPYSSEIFKNVEYFTYHGIRVPVCSLESLFLYYLILRRGLNDGKNDYQKIKEIIDSGKIKEDIFFELIRDHPQEAKIIALYKSHLK